MIAPRDSGLGFKLPTLDDWLERDTAWDVFGHTEFAEDGSLQHIPEAPDTWIASVRDPQLSESVPVEIRKLYEVARSSIIYGYLCYPLLTLGIEQLHRVVELVARLRARDLGCATKRKSFDGQAQLPAFKEAIDWLVDKSVIPQSDRDRWDAMRHLRNIASHPTTQTILMPGNAISFLRWALEAVELLYSQSLP